MSASVSPIQEAIAKAQAEAGKIAAAQAGALTPQTPANSNVPAPVRPGAPLAMSDMSGGGITVESWMGVSEYGLLFTDKKTMINTPVRVLIDMTAVAPNYAIKFGNPAQYFKTYDRVTSNIGGSWAEAVAKAMAAGASREYRSVDIPMTIMEDIKTVDPKTKAETVVVPANTVVGHSTSTTNWGNWDSFYRSLCKAGLEREQVIVELTAEPRTNKNANRWGVIAFTLVGPANDNEAGE